MKEESYDYFNPNEDDDNEPEKEPDITWVVNDDGSSSQIVDNNNDDEKQEEEEDSQPHGLTGGESEPNEPEKPLGFWGKVKKCIIG